MRYCFDYEILLPVNECYNIDVVETTAKHCSSIERKNSSHKVAIIQLKNDKWLKCDSLTCGNIKII